MNRFREEPLTSLDLPPDDAPRLVVTGLNRGHYEDLRGRDMVSAMRHKWPQLCALYLAALWPGQFRLGKRAASASASTDAICSSRSMMSTSMAIQRVDNLTDESGASAVAWPHDPQNAGDAQHPRVPCPLEVPLAASDISSRRNGVIDGRCSRPALHRRVRFHLGNPLRTAALI